MVPDPIRFFERTYPVICKYNISYTEEGILPFDHGLNGLYKSFNNFL